MGPREVRWGGAGLGPRDMGGWAAIRRVVVDAAVGGRACGGLLCPSVGASLVPREAGAAIRAGDVEAVALRWSLRTPLNELRRQS